MTVGGKSSNNSLEEEAELENLEVKRRDDEKKAGGQAGDKSECSLCQAPTSLSCPACGVTCCSLHLTAHRPADVCLPFTVRVGEGVGRYVVATRDIKAGQVILEDRPACLGPCFDTEAVCVECLGRPDGSVLCHHCQLPLCSEACRDGPNHKPECKMFAAMEPKVTIKQYPKSLSTSNSSGRICHEYGCITVLRLLSLRDSDPDSWARVQLLMDHDEERRKELEYWKMFQKNVVDYIRIVGNLADTYSDDEIHRAIGILRTNAFQVEHDYMKAVGTDGKAIYPTFSFLSHSCSANGRYVVMPDNKLELRAQVDIAAGEEVTIQYITFLFGNTRRRRDIHQCWFFDCRCPRCQDRTEFGLLFSAHACQECGGPVLPENNVLYCKDWRCESCGWETTAEKVEAIESEIEADMYDTYEYDTAKYRTLLEKWSPKLHPNHFQVLLLKKRLAISMNGTLSFDQIREKIILQEEFLEKYDLVDPGLTKWKGKLLFVICKLRMFLADQEMARERITKQEFTGQLHKCITGLDEVIRCLNFEPRATVEGKIAAEAKMYLNQAKEIQRMTEVLG